MVFGLLVLAVFAVVFAMMAKWISTTSFTAPMVFIGFGTLLSVTGLFPHENAEQALHLVAEIALVILLFLDARANRYASASNTACLADQDACDRISPLTVFIGTVAAWLFFPNQPVFALVLIAVILAPTDAALGQAVVTNPQVPERVRRALTVESGLNDGLALPAILLFASLTAEVMEKDGTDWILFGAMQLTLGPVTGIAVGLVGGAALIWAKDNNMTSEPYEGVGAIALAGASYLAATLMGGNGFIAAFAAGLCFGYVVKGQCKFVYEFTESEGLLLTWGAFFLLGLALVPEAVQQLSFPVFGFILVSLVVVRPLSIWISLIGTDASFVTRLFFGWFGPRGLATALFALLIVSHIDHELAEFVLMLSVNAVWISAVLHGVLANPSARWYGAKVKEMGNCPETHPIEHSAKPLRGVTR